MPSIGGFILPEMGRVVHLGEGVLTAVQWMPCEEEQDKGEERHLKDNGNHSQNGQRGSEPSHCGGK